MKRLFILTAVILFTGVFIVGQTRVETARQKLSEAIELMDNGSHDEAIAILESAKKLEPGNYIYDYEIGLAYYLKEEYKKASSIFKKLTKLSQINDQVYQMLGNAYDYGGNSKKALKAYDDGLKRFPASGLLYLEKGNMYWMQEKYDVALGFYEKGIDVDPMLPSNYFRASIIYCNSEEEMWGILYGETFLNLEFGTERRDGLSNLLYETYKSEITFPTDSSISVSFSKEMTLTLSDLRDVETLKIPFAVAVFEKLMGLACAGETKIDLMSLARIRERFINMYYENNYHELYPVAIFDFQKVIADKGYYLPYSLWLLRGGEPDTFNAWVEENQEQWDEFIEWFNYFLLELDHDNKLVKGRL